MREIETSDGTLAKVDNADYAWLRRWKWYAVTMLPKDPSRTYVYRVLMRRGVRRKVFLHRLLANASMRHDRVAWVNGNTLDCQRKNLRKNGRKITAFETMKHFHMMVGGVGETRRGYHNIDRRSRNCYRVSAQIEKTRYFIATTRTMEEAVQAWNEFCDKHDMPHKRQKYHGEPRWVRRQRAA